MNFRMDVNIFSTVSVVFVMAIPAAAAALAMSKAIAAALESMARQHEVRGSITTTMIIGLALIEALVIYCLVVSLILMFVNPFKS